MADVAQMELVNFDPIDGDYQDGGGTKYAQLPVEGKYVGRVPMITDEVFGLTKENYRKVNLPDIEVLGTGEPSYFIRYQSLSAKKYKGRNGNQVVDFLRACGISQIPKSDDELKSLVKQTSGRTFQFQLVWEAYDKDTEKNISGMDNFPPDPANPAERLRFVMSDADSTKKVWANGKIKYFISAVGN